jgi:hypothetical protein
MQMSQGAIMTFLEELAVKEAVRTGNGALLKNTVSRMAFPDYAAIERAVDGEPNSYGAVSYRGVTVGGVCVVNRAGRATVQS